MEFEQESAKEAMWNKGEGVLALIGNRGGV